MFPNRGTPEQRRKDLRKFGVMVGGILLLIGLFLLWRGYHKPIQVGLWTIGGILVVFGAIAPTLLRPIYVGWMKFAFILGWVNSRIILSLIFYLLFTPIGLIMRLFGRDALDRRMSGKSDSYWVKREPITSVKEHSERQF